ncbi:hypothetical protein KIN20_038446 [Parelaphostrongylus tenuis]|uniref:Solute carrier family 3 member 2 N-terminal domain-containing protein n=1 Tax=Parelaphostrongylus tenuis TaxID=148309 RepID=A0AAD5WGA5_PARTN|nr:hypothetical protein KIN20_038446 [Parelaphostrongylus tenuis]
MSHSASTMEMDQKSTRYDSTKHEELHSKPLIGLTKEQLELARQSRFWKIWRVSVFSAFWLLWIVMVAGAILIILLDNNADLPSTTTATPPNTTTNKYPIFLAI